MRALAEYLLRGRAQATWVAVFAAAVPLLFWLSAAAVGLVTLRRGPQAGLVLLLWAALPAMGWWMLQQDPQVLVVLVTTWGLAVILERTVSWQRTLFGGVALATLISLTLPALLPGLQQELVRALGDVYRDLSPELVEQLGSRFDSALSALVAGAFAASHLLLALVCLMLARSWQAQLFNPGGFRREFHELRMPPLYAGLALLVTLVGPSLDYAAISVVPAFLVPLVIAGFALVHGIVGKRNLGVHWLIAFYAVAIFMGPSTLFLLMIVAVVDSFINFRGRIGTE